MRAVRDSAARPEAERLVELRRSGLSSPEAKPVEVAPGRRDGLLDKLAADAASAAFGQDVDVAHSPDPGIIQVGIDAETADPHPSAGQLRDQQSLTGTR